MADDTNLMSQEFASEPDDPLSLPEVHEHMVRSPPPTSWPRSPRFSLFSFPQENQKINLSTNEVIKGCTAII